MLHFKGPFVSVIADTTLLKRTVQANLLDGGRYSDFWGNVLGGLCRARPPESVHRVHYGVKCIIFFSLGARRIYFYTPLYPTALEISSSNERVFFLIGGFSRWGAR